MKRAWKQLIEQGTVRAIMQLLTWPHLSANHQIGRFKSAVQRRSTRSLPQEGVAGFGGSQRSQQGIGSLQNKACQKHGALDWQ